jgi:hypothetical protein
MAGRVSRAPSPIPEVKTDRAWALPLYSTVVTFDVGG